MIIRLIILSIAVSCVFTQINYDYSGNILFGTINRTSDASLIKVPFRFINYRTSIEYDSFTLKSNLALEVSLSDETMSIDNRELYLSWYPSFGEVRVGKQINSWGVGSTNSPLDILSPVNYYYFFSRGIEKNIGVYTFLFDLYSNNIKLSTVIIPYHDMNILPINDDEMPISIDNLPKNMIFTEINKPLQYGISAQTNLNDIDFTLSYFSGYDNLMTFYGANLWGNSRTKDPNTAYIDTVLSFRQSNMMGLGFSTFVDEVTIKGEFAYFDTDDNINSRSKLHRGFNANLSDVCTELDLLLGCEEFLLENLPVGTNANYYQFLIEFEFPILWEINLTGQYLKYELLDISKGYDPPIYIQENINLTPKDNFMPALGSPIFMFTIHEDKQTNTLYMHESSVAYLNIKKYLFDHTLEVNMRTFWDLVNHGNLFEIEGIYTVSDNVNAGIALNKISGNSSLNSTYMFNSMENFSHLRVEVTYNF